MERVSDSPEEFIRNYEKAANSCEFLQVEPMISENAVFWFSDGSYSGIENIRRAFKDTWATIKEEKYEISELKWIHKSKESAVCIYNFISKGKINGETVETRGRGTNVLVMEDNHWKIAHEHLSMVR